MNHTTIRLAIIVVAATLMISGTIFYPMVRKQQAYSVSSTTHQFKNEEEAAAVRSSLQQRGQQHMDQENLCLRTSNCNNSNVGEQTLGNDNSITGFADQSKNTQTTVTPTQVIIPTPVVTPTPVITPTPIPTPTPTPTPTLTVPGPAPSNCNGVEDSTGPFASVQENEDNEQQPSQPVVGTTDPDPPFINPWPPGVVCPPGEDEPTSSGLESTEQSTPGGPELDPNS